MSLSFTKIIIFSTHCYISLPLFISLDLTTPVTRQISVHPLLFHDFRNILLVFKQLLILRIHFQESITQSYHFPMNMYHLMSYTFFSLSSYYFIGILLIVPTYHIFLSIQHNLQNSHHFLSLTMFFCQLPYSAWQRNFPDTYHAFLALAISSFFLYLSCWQYLSVVVFQRLQILFCHLPYVPACCQISLFLMFLLLIVFFPATYSISANLILLLPNAFHVILIAKFYKFIQSS